MRRERGGQSWPLGLLRPSEGRVVAGVCAGIGERFAMDPTLLRLAALVLLLASGLGLLIYAVAWALIPAEGNATSNVLAVLRDNGRGLVGDLRQIGDHAAEVWARADRVPWPRPLTRRWVAVGLISLGGLVLLGSLGLFGWLTATRVIALLLIIVGASVLVARLPQLRR
jgi:phage shock protein PspC (stress-responsive transcriptional regulator)